MKQLLDQNDTPIMTALRALKSARIVPFDVPGHKRGRGNAELSDFLGEKCLSADVNSMKPLDNLCRPVSVIKEAQQLAAQAFGAQNAFFMLNGTTGAVQAMIMAVCKKGDKLILPRNVHISVINALVICGAVPVYVNPSSDSRLGIPLGMSFAGVREAVERNPDAKAVLVNNPTYYGICSPIEKIAALTRQYGMKLLADEAHGTHLYFGEGLPAAAIRAGADLSAVSMHKSGGSLTQSSLLLTGKSIDPDYMRQIINLTQTTSGSYLLMASLDISRKNLALHGRELFRTVSRLAEYAREEINAIGDYYAFSHELVNGDSVFAFDQTKLSVNTLGIGLAGIEVYDILRDEYDIQIEFGDIGNILAYLSVGDSIKNIERLISALSEIKRRYRKDSSGMLAYEYISPDVALAPQEAFYAEKAALPLRESVSHISAEFVMCYPPGIPVLAPGERITEAIRDYILYAREKGCLLTGTQDVTLETILVVKKGG